VNTVELYLVGRKLMKIAEDALPRPDGNALPASVRMVMVDVAEHPGSSIGEITARTGFPQSLVSASIARLREFQAVQTATDPADARRTLVTASSRLEERARRVASPIDQTIAAALTDATPDDLRRVGEALELLGKHLIPDAIDPTDSGAETQARAPQTGASSHHSR